MERHFGGEPANTRIDPAQIRNRLTGIGATVATEGRYSAQPGMRLSSPSSAVAASSSRSTSCATSPTTFERRIVDRRYLAAGGPG